MLKVLGASGSYSHNTNATSFLIDNHIAIDAGNIIKGIGEECCNLEHIFITHTHFDHIIDLPFIIESYFQCRHSSLKIYALPDNIKILQDHVFNGDIWPHFDKILQKTTEAPCIEFVPIEFGETISINEIDITILKSIHTVPTCGFKVTKDNHSFILSGDTYLNPELIKMVNEDKQINSLIIDVSFSSEKEELAKVSKHLTPKLLNGMLEDLERDDLTVYTYHQKPRFIDKIDKELVEFGILYNGGKRLETGDYVDVFSPSSNRKPIKNFTHKRTEHEHLNNLFKIAKTIQDESDLPKLLGMIVVQSMKFTSADGATLYLLDEEKQELMFKVLHNETLDVHINDMHDDVHWPNLPLYNKDQTPNESLIAVRTALHKKTMLVDDIYNNDNFNFEGTKAFDKTTGYRSLSMLVVPLLNHENEIIGVLQLINKKSPEDNVISFDSFDLESTNALAAQASTAIINATLIHELEKSFELFITTIATAINSKSKETGEHVRKVSKIADLLAKGIHSTNTGKYKDITYTKDDFKQINLAALLHDVGKIAVPEHVMEKSKKLETVTDRIVLLDERIEILKRDIEIDYLNKELTLLKARKPIPENFEEEKNIKLNTLENARLFLHESNRGSEYLDEDKIEHLYTLSELTYTLKDKEVKLLRPDELENLSIPRGTLTNFERCIIHNHAQVSVDILNSIKFPKLLCKVPDIACNHHEKLDGTGYPRQLTAEQLTLEDRIMILADMFEALSASNRSYKTPNSMNEIAEILKRFIDAGHMDKDLVKFFFESGIYKEYAKNELLPEQQDTISIDFDR